MKKVFLVIPFFLFFGAGVFFVKRISMLHSSSVEKITQLALQKEALPTLYLAELLGLSYDKKVCREELDVESLRKKLVASPLIEEAEVSFLRDDHIKVSYKHVTPIARIMDFRNRGVDKDGNIFPIKPYLSPIGLPMIFLGVKSVSQGENISNYSEKERWFFAKKCLENLNSLELPGQISFIDVSKIFEPSLGKNEVIVCIKHLKRKDFLRLSRRNYLNEVSNYIILCDKLKEETGVRMIDFRFDSCAFIEKF